jgi:beta-lactam-binding protein with PASTA domain
LTLGEIKEERQTDLAKIGKVIDQSPENGKTVDSGTAVNITLGSAKATELQERK